MVFVFFLRVYSFADAREKHTKDAAVIVDSMNAQRHWRSCWRRQEKTEKNEVNKCKSGLNSCLIFSYFLRSIHFILCRSTCSTSSLELLSKWSDFLVNVSLSSHPKFNSFLREITFKWKCNVKSHQHKWSRKCNRDKKKFTYVCALLAKFLLTKQKNGKMTTKN